MLSRHFGVVVAVVVGHPVVKAVVGCPVVVVIDGQPLVLLLGNVLDFEIIFSHYLCYNSSKKRLFYTA